MQHAWRRIPRSRPEPAKCKPIYRIRSFSYVLLWNKEARTSPYYLAPVPLIERYKARTLEILFASASFFLRPKFAPLFEGFQVFRRHCGRGSWRDNRVYDANSDNNSHSTVEQIFAICRSIIYLSDGDMKEKVHRGLPRRRARE